jgi:hypothetical protein
MVWRRASFAGESCRSSAGRASRIALFVARRGVGVGESELRGEEAGVGVAYYSSKFEASGSRAGASIMRVEGVVVVVIIVTVVGRQAGRGGGIRSEGVSPR